MNARVLRSGGRVSLEGRWTITALAPEIKLLRSGLAATSVDEAWSLDGVTQLDAFGAMLLWRAWGGRFPITLSMQESHASAFERVKLGVEHALPEALLNPSGSAPRGVHRFGHFVLDIAGHLRGMVELIGQVSLEFWSLPSHLRELPWLEISASSYKMGVQALPVAALLGFLIGVVMSYLSALQLQNFGAENFLINVLGFGVIRELGPVLVAILAAGRSGSAITAQIGVMRVTEEMDALAVMGVSRYQRLIMPKVAAMTLVMPLLVAWTSFMALLGGALSAKLTLNLDLWNFIERLPSVVPIGNIWLGLGKGAVFGMAIAMVACHFGLRVQPNTESLSRNTTASVVTSITVVILLDAIFAVLTRTVGVPR